MLLSFGGLAGCLPSTVVGFVKPGKEQHRLFRDVAGWRSSSGAVELSFRWLSIATSGGCCTTSAAERMPLSLQVGVLLGVFHPQ